MTDSMFWSAINISEGRDLSALANLASKISDSGVQLADWSADPDHHRSVFSLVGGAPQIERAVELIFGWALCTLDLSKHSGAHPRLGAIDVIPFVPLSSDATIEKAHIAAKKTAQNIAEKFNIPTFLYRNSSTQATPNTLPQLRRGGLVGLTQRMLDGEIKADFGPSSPHPTLGVTVVGARTPLVAFNCLTDTTDLSIGQEIVREIRGSNGGVPELQALAFVLETAQGAVQMSMNLTNPDITPPHVAYLAVRDACQKRNVQLVKSELVGLVPVRAVQDAFQHFLQIDTMHPGQIAESHLLKTRLEGKSQT